jgi:hypothetical protein
MNHIFNWRFFAFLPVLFSFHHGALAQNSPPPPPLPEKLSLENYFRQGQWELAAGGGVLFSPIGPTRNRPVLNYALGNLQLGLMLTDLRTNGFLRGNFELVQEGFGAGIFQGPGNYIAGETLWLRYNFVPPRWQVLPYAQGGGGFVVTNINHRYDGQDFNFNLGLAAGLRWFMAPRYALNLEYRLQHISNANLGSRNIGINAHGPVLDLSWFF